MISWQQRAFRIPATSLRLNKAKAIVHAPRKKFNTGIGSDASGRNATKKSVNQDPPGNFMQSLRSAYRSWLPHSPEKPEQRSESILMATKLQAAQADDHHVQLNIGKNGKSLATPAPNLQTVPAQVPEASSVDFLSLAISIAPSKEEFLQVVDKHGSIMNTNHLLLCLRKFVKLVEIGNSPEELQGTPGFQNLTEIMLIRKTLFDARDCVEIFESMRKFESGTDSPLGQQILEVLRLKLQDLTLHELMQFYFLIRNMEGEGPHLDVMRLVIPIVFQTRCRKEINMSNIDECHTSLIFILTTKMDSEESRAIVDAVLKVAPRFTTSQAVTVLHHAGDHALLVRNLESLRQIIVECMQIVSGTLPELDEQTIKQIIVSCCEHRTATKSFFDALWKVAPSWSLSQVGHLLNACFRENCAYMTPETADAVPLMLLEKKAQSHEVTAANAPLFAETIALSSRNHQPESDRMLCCVQAANVLIEAETCMKELQENPPAFLKFLLALSYLGLFPESLLRKLFSDVHEKELPYDTSQLLAELERQVIIHYKGNPPYPIKANRSLAVESRSVEENDPFTEVLVAALGDERYLHKNVKTPLGTRAHYIVALRGKNQPILIPHTTDFFQAIPSWAKVIAILICRNGRDTFNLTGMEKLHISIRQRQLQAQNLCAVVINENTLFSPRATDTAPQVATALEEAYENGCEYSPKPFLKEALSVAGI